MSLFNKNEPETYQVTCPYCNVGVAFTAANIHHSAGFLSDPIIQCPNCSSNIYLTISEEDNPMEDTNQTNQQDQPIQLQSNPQSSLIPKIQLVIASITLFLSVTKLALTLYQAYQDLKEDT